MAGGTTIDVLTRAESIELLQYRSYVGRIAFIVDGRPMIFPVNYLAGPDEIVFCTAPGTKLDVVAHGAVVAFEVDDSSPLDHAGWSVLVQGTAREITDADAIEGLRRGPLKSWAVGESQHWVRITIEEISGRRIAKDD